MSEYNIGDVANGYVLTEHGWMPLAPVPTPKPKKPGRKALAISGVVLLGAVACSAAVASGDNSGTVPVSAPSVSQPSASPNTSKPTPKPTVSESTPEPTVRESTPEPTADESTPETHEPKPEPVITMAQDNALRAAENYLETMPFSKQGLIEQLSSEYGSAFALKDAKWAVNHVDANWKEQAVRAAENYLETMPFSKQGLIEQLSSEYGSKFTYEQAVYAVKKVGL